MASYLHLRAKTCPSILILLQCLIVLCMTPSRKLELREEARVNFRHGWENYMMRAFPQDEAGSPFAPPPFRLRALLIVLGELTDCVDSRSSPYRVLLTTATGIIRTTSAGMTQWGSSLSPLSTRLAPLP